METDVLGAPYQQRRITLEPDYEGEVVATLVSLRAATPTRRAVLYLHGYVDYFFQTHLAEFFTARGYDFYALDLRVRSQPAQPPDLNFCRDIAEYYRTPMPPSRSSEKKTARHRPAHGHSTGGLSRLCTRTGFAADALREIVPEQSIPRVQCARG